jgi:hypothetical protein
MADSAGPGGEHRDEDDLTREVPGYVWAERDFYRKASDISHRGYLASQCLALGAATSVSVVAAVPSAPRWVSATLGAVAALATGIGLIFRFKDNFASRSLTLEKIRATIAAYEVTRTMTEEELVQEVRKHVLDETAQWKEGFLGTTRPSSGVTQASDEASAQATDREGGSGEDSQVGGTI